MATVQHANLCPVYDVGRFEQWHFLTMAFIDGQPLSKKLKEAGGLAMLPAVALLKKVALAVQKAHEAGIVHRAVQTRFSVGMQVIEGHEPKLVQLLPLLVASPRQMFEVPLQKSGTSH